ncbi:MAG TPA: PilZ domain-containing protein [Polyangia bacterium]|nr:PilZ domain-containing protein [Polyangia bacterium]
MTGARPQVNANSGTKPGNRRQHPRVGVGLPVEVHVSGRNAAVTVELVDIAAAGVRFRPMTDIKVETGLHATFMFIVAGGSACTAEGRITRVEPGGEFIVVLDQTNPAFRAFVRSLSS